MPWQLATPITVGILDPAGDLTHARAVLVRHEPSAKTMLCHISYGRMPSNEYNIAEIHPPGRAMTVRIADADYDNLIAMAANSSESAYAAAKRVIYEYLAATGYLDPGSVV